MKLLCLLQSVLQGGFAKVESANQFAAELKAREIQVEKAWGGFLILRLVSLALVSQGPIRTQRNENILVVTEDEAARTVELRIDLKGSLGSGPHTQANEYAAMSEHALNKCNPGSKASGPLVQRLLHGFRNVCGPERLRALLAIHHFFKLLSFETSLLDPHTVLLLKAACFLVLHPLCVLEIRVAQVAWALSLSWHKPQQLSSSAGAQQQLVLWGMLKGVKHVQALLYGGVWGGVSEPPNPKNNVTGYFRGNQGVWVRGTGTGPGLMWVCASLFTWTYSVVQSVPS